MRYIEYGKRMLVLSAAALCVAIVNLKPAAADSTTNNYLYNLNNAANTTNSNLSQGNNYLAMIANNTFAILAFIQNSGLFAGLAASWMQLDTGDNSISSQAQQNIAMSGVMNSLSQIVTKNLQRQIIADIVDMPLDSFSGKKPAVLVDIPQINDLSFGTIIGVAPVDSAPKDMYGFIKNTAAFNSPRAVPNSSWEGDEASRKKYKDYYDTITSIQSFDAYLLTRVAMDNAMGGSQTRDNLINMASNSSWVAQIATEELGRVLRQILLFESQNFVLNMKMQETMQLMASAQAMSNALLIKLNEVNEYNLLRSAKGKSSSF